jgi:hypothetical protein
VPADGVRDLPDVSLFASNGANLSAYGICAYEGECAPGAGDEVGFLLVGGTSASSPAMAGIMALVNQKYGRQGQANYTLYALAQQKHAAFHDIAVGSNSFPCIWGDPDETCVQEANGFYGTPQYPAGPGYDQASGLGSVDAAVLVNNWNALTFLPTTTKLELSSTTATHGSPVTVTTSVAPQSGAGTPTGDVAILTDSTLPASQSQLFISLNSGAGASSVNYLPGGRYEVTGRYGGDGTYAASTSSPVTLTVTPEKANLNFALMSGQTAIGTGGSVQYNAPLAMTIQPVGVSATAGMTNGNATGTATFTVDSTPATVALNSSGVAAWRVPALGVGTHTATASYSGDASFAAATSAPVTFSVTPGMVRLTDNEVGPYTYELAPGSGEVLPWPYMNTGSSLTIGVTAQGWNTYGAYPTQIPLGTTAPTGTVRICLGQGFAMACQDPSYSQTATLVPLSGNNAQESLAVAFFPNLAAGSYMPSVQYNGDSNWAPGGLIDIRQYIVQAMPPSAATTTTLSIAPTVFSGTQTAKVTATVTGSGNAGTSPTGEIDFYDNDVILTYWPYLAGVAGSTSTFSFDVTPSWFLNSGANQLTAVYWGDGANGPSVSNALSFSATQTVGDFTLAPQIPQVTVQAGGAGTVLLNLQSLSSFNGAVALSCAPSSSQIGCTLNPATVALTGSATATLTIQAAAQTAAVPAPTPPGQPGWPMAAGVLAFGFIFAGGRASRKLRRSVLLSLGLFAALFATSCGGASGTSQSTSSSPQTTPAAPSPPGSYSVLVTGTANGIVHNAKITVLVP